MKRIPSAVLTLILLLSFCSCSSDSGTNADTDSTVDTTTTVPETTEPTPLDALQGLDFADADFRISYPDGFQGETYSKYLLAEEMTGELMNDTSLERYNTVAQLLHVKFSFYEQIQGRALADTLPTILAGEDAYDILQYGSAWEKPMNMIQQNALYNIRTLPYVDLTSDYLYADLNEQFTINDKLYFAISSYNNAGNLPLYMAFNKNLMQSLNIELPYETIFAGDFTYDYFLQTINDAAVDLDGDGKIGVDDRWGYANVTSLSNYLVFGFDTTVVTRTENGAYTPALSGEKLVSSIQKVVAFTKENKDAYNTNSINPDGVHVFTRGNTLYTTSGTSALDLRSIEDFDFGIAPFPKYDEDQQDYTCYLLVDPFCVPMTISDTEKVGAVTEALAYVSSEEMTPAFLEVYVENKFLRDEDSVKVVQMMLDNVCIDVTRYYDFANGAITPVTMLSSITDAGAVASKLASISNVATSQAEAFFAVFFED